MGGHDDDSDRWTYLTSFYFSRVFLCDNPLCNRLTLCRWRTVGYWVWNTANEECPICQMPLDSCCEDCSIPGDSCPPGKISFIL